MDDMSHAPKTETRDWDLGPVADAARAASRELARLTPEQRSEGIRAMAAEVRAAAASILDANARDLEGGRKKGLDAAMMDRLALDEERINAIAGAMEAIADMDDPVGRELARWQVPSGLDIARVACPLGVIAIIYESRPNVTADAGTLCVRSGNAAILRCGSESRASSEAIVDAMQAGLKTAGLPAHAVQLVPTQDRAAVGEILSGLNGRIDVVVPRGGKGLVERVHKEARIPVIGHLEGICHTYIDRDADLDEAVSILLNAKMRRTGICGSTETALVDRAIAEKAVPAIAEALGAAGCELRGDDEACALSDTLLPAHDAEWSTEHLAAVLGVRVVDGIDGALAHIDRYSTGHTEAILTENAETAAHFLSRVDAAIVMHNASTQFADGGEFGMGAEIGIATGRIHARGPVGAEQLTIFKYVVRGTGQTRP